MEKKKCTMHLLKVTGFVLVFIAGYIILKGSRHSQLAGYFIYMSVACTVIPLPTPPFVIAMGKVFHPVIVAFFGSLGNCIAAYAEYYFLTWFFGRTEIYSRVKANKVFQKFSWFFNKASFLCLIFSGFTPIPFEPFRLAAIVDHYPLPKYLAAVFIGRFPRYYLIALLGYVFHIPTTHLIILLLILLIIPVLSTLKSKIAKKNIVI